MHDENKINFVIRSACGMAKLPTISTKYHSGVNKTVFLKIKSGLTRNIKL